MEGVVLFVLQDQCEDLLHSVCSGGAKGLHVAERSSGCIRVGSDCLQDTQMATRVTSAAGHMP